MKKLLVAGIAAAALYSAPALAGPPQSGVFNWSGFYIGANGGGGKFDKTDGPFDLLPGLTWHTDSKNIGIAGLHGGYQSQWGNLVAGLEGGITWNLDSGFGSTLGGTSGCSAGFPFACQARVGDILTAGARLGWAWDRLLFYGSGGYARTLIEERFFNTVTGVSFQPTSSAHHDGWYAGAGIDYALLNNLILGIDWRHYGINSAHQFYPPPSNPTNLNTVSSKGDAVTVRLTLKGGG